MTFSDKALGNGWHDQAARLAGMHGRLGRRAAHAASGAEAALAEELERANAQIARLEQRLEQEAATAQALREHVQLLHTQFEDAERRAEELESELAAACDSAALHDNESQSLRVSLDLATEASTQLAQRLEQSDAALAGAHAELARLQDTDESRLLQVAFDRAMAENAQLSQNLEASEAALGNASAELARLRMTLAEATNERSKLAGELFEANGKRFSESSELKEQLEAMAVRAETAERLLTEMRECLLTRTAEKKAAERSLVEITAARCDADDQIKRLHDLLCVKQCQINELEQSRDKLAQSHAELEQSRNKLAQSHAEMEQSRDRLAQSHDELEQSRNELAQSRDELVSATNALLKTCASRDTALARADQKIETLAKRIAQLEGEARQASRRRAVARNAAARNAQPGPPAASSNPVDTAADDYNRIKWAELAVELDKLVKLKSQLPEPLPAGPTNALLASTITF